MDYDKLSKEQLIIMLKETKEQNEKLTDSLTASLEREQNKNETIVLTMKETVVDFNKKEKDILKNVIWVICIILIVIYIF